MGFSNPHPVFPQSGPYPQLPHPIYLISPIPNPGYGIPQSPICVSPVPILGFPNPLPHISYVSLCSPNLKLGISPFPNP